MEPVESTVPALLGNTNHIPLIVAALIPPVAVIAALYLPNPSYGRRLAAITILAVLYPVIYLYGLAYSAMLDEQLIVLTMATATLCFWVGLHKLITRAGRPHQGTAKVVLGIIGTVILFCCLLLFLVIKAFESAPHH